MAGRRLEVTVKTDVHRASEEFKQARRELNRDTKQGLLRAAEQVALPYARGRAPGFAKAYLTARATSRNAYLTTKGPRWVGRATGLLEFGGTVRTPLHLRGGGAFPVAPGEFRAAVYGPRHYRGQHRLTRAVQSRSHQIAEAVEREVVRRLQS